MLGVLQVVIPVFLVLGAGYLATRVGYLKDAHVDALNSFTQGFAIPVLLFRAMLNLDLGTVAEPGLLIAFYTGSTITFVLGMLGARFLFGRRPGEAVAVGFGAFFSNTVVIGIPIVERAFGADALAASLLIIAFHAPYCYLVGITVMEVSRADGRSLRETALVVANEVRKNALMIGIFAGIAANLMGVTLPEPVRSAVDMVASAGLPTALIGLGGVLTRYKLSSTMGEAAMISFLSLVLHPAITFLLAHVVFGLPDIFVKGVVLTSAMAPGVNAYIFAAMYDRAQGTAASTVLLATGLSVFSVSVWLSILNAM